jgi:chromosome segregation ATPase
MFKMGRLMEMPKSSLQMFVKIRENSQKVTEIADVIRERVKQEREREIKEFKECKELIDQVISELSKVLEIQENVDTDLGRAIEEIQNTLNNEYIPDNSMDKKIQNIREQADAVRNTGLNMFSEMFKHIEKANSEIRKLKRENEKLQQENKELWESVECYENKYSEKYLLKKCDFLESEFQRVLSDNNKLQDESRDVKHSLQQFFTTILKQRLGQCRK